MLVTTTPTIEGWRITRCRGVVAGEAILGANLFKDLFAGIRDDHHHRLQHQVHGPCQGEHRRDRRDPRPKRWPRSTCPRSTT